MLAHDNKKIVGNGMNSSPQRRTLTKIFILTIVKIASSWYDSISEEGYAIGFQNRSRFAALPRLRMQRAPVLAATLPVYTDASIHGGSQYRFLRAFAAISLRFGW